MMHRILIFLFCLVLIDGCCSCCEAQTLAPVIRQPVRSSAAAAEADVSDFRTAIFRAVREARKNRSITARDAMRIRVALFSPSFRQHAEDLAITQMAFFDGEGVPELTREVSGKVDRTAINWDGLASFLERLLPLLMELLNAFAVIEIGSVGATA